MGEVQHVEAAEAVSARAEESGITFVPREKVDLIFEREMARWSTLLERLK
ncbi:hypothetical protein [Nocardia sp. NPDC047648]